MKGAKKVIGAVIALILIFLLGNPQWLPFGKQTSQAMKDLQSQYFLIERSGQVTIAHILTMVLAITVVWLAYTVIKVILKLVGRKDDHTNTITGLLTSILKYISVVVAIVWSLRILGIDSTAVLAGVGLIGLILGFGAQSLIEDIITGFFIIFERKYEIGDIIILDDFRGTVRDIGVRTTVIEDAGGNLKVVNNSDIRNFQNRSRNQSFALCEVSVSYDTDLKELESILKDSLPIMYEQHKDMYLSEPRYLGVSALADSGVVLKLGVNVKEENIFGAQRQLLRDIKILFDETGIVIPFPQVVVHKGD